MPIVKLHSPDGAQIVGFVAKDGSVRPFECRYSPGAAENKFIYVIDGEHWESDVSDHGDMVFADENGETWRASDIQNNFRPPRA